jgi:hypothetical protein
MLCGPRRNLRNQKKTTWLKSGLAAKAVFDARGKIAENLLKKVRESR